MARKALTLHMDEGVIDDFRNYCKLNAIKLSEKVELLFKREMENAPNNPTLVKMFEEILNNQNHKQASQSSEQSKINDKEYNNHGNDDNNNKNKEYNTELQSRPEKINKPKPNVPSIEHLRRLKGL